MGKHDTIADMKSGIKAALVVLAAGSATRFGHTTNKVWLPLSGRRIISRSLTNAAKNFKNARIILVINPDDEALAQEVIKREMAGLKIEVVYGGITRHESEHNALIHLAPAINSGEVEVVLIHDGARPLATPLFLLRLQMQRIVTAVQFQQSQLIHVRWTWFEAIQLCAYKHRKVSSHANC